MERETPLLSESPSLLSSGVSRRKTVSYKADSAADQGPELRGCVKVEVAVLSSPSLKVLMVSVDGKQQ